MPHTHEAYPLPEDVLLLDESIDTLTQEEIERRRAFGAAVISMVPAEALRDLSVLQPAVGCLSQCSFCSQEAGPGSTRIGRGLAAHDHGWYPRGDVRL